MLYGCECWPIKKEDLRRLERNERTMLRWMCHIKPGGNTSTEDIRQKLGLSDLSREIGYRRLRWFGHVYCSSNATKRILDLQVAGRRKRGCPRMSWRELVDGDLRDRLLSPRDALDRVFWKRTLASRMQRLANSCV